MRTSILLIFLFSLASLQSAAGSNTTEGGNITLLNVTLQNTSTWYGICGAVSSPAFSNVTINATAGTVDCSFTIATGSSGCPNGVSFTSLIFSNTSQNFTSLSAGNLSALDDFINRTIENGSNTFTSSRTFETAGWGNITSVPTAYTEPASQQDFPEGYLQDSAGNLAFIAPVTSDKTGFNGTLYDFQAILPTYDGQNTTYYLRVDMACNAANVTPSPVPAPPSSSFVTPGFSIPYFSQVPKITLPVKPPTALDLRVLRFSPFREASAGDSIVISPLLENPTPSFVTVSVGLAGPEAPLASPSENVLIAPNEKRTVPFSVRLPSDMPVGYYAFSVLVELNGTNTTYPTIIRIVPTYRIGQPVVQRQFLIDYERGETDVVLTVRNTGTELLQQLQISEALPASISSLAQSIRLSTEPGSIEGELQPYGTGQSIRWSVLKLNPGETRSIIYRIPLLLTDVTEFPAWNIAQMVATSPIGPYDIVIRDVLTPTLLPGEKGEISFKLFNQGPVRRDVDLDVLVPQGWKANPQSLSLSLDSQEMQEGRILVDSPAGSQSGTYGFTLQVNYGPASFDRLLYIYVNKPVVEIFAPPLADQLSTFLGANVLPIAFALVAGGLLLAGLWFAYRTINAPKYDESRLEDMQNMERMFDQKTRGKKGL